MGRLSVRHQPSYSNEMEHEQPGRTVRTVYLQIAIRNAVYDHGRMANANEVIDEQSIYGGYKR